MGSGFVEIGNRRLHAISCEGKGHRVAIESRGLGSVGSSDGRTPHGTGGVPHGVSMLPHLVRTDFHRHHGLG